MDKILKWLLDFANLRELSAIHTIRPRLGRVDRFKPELGSAIGKKPELPEFPIWGGKQTLSFVTTGAVVVAFGRLVFLT